MIPETRSSEFFGWAALVSRFAGFLGPLMYAAIGHATGNIRLGLIAPMCFIFLGGVALLCVDFERGENLAQSQLINRDSETVSSYGGSA